MANGSSDGGGDDGVKIEGGVIAAPQAVLKHLLHFDGLQDDVKVKGEGGVIMAKVDEIEDIVFLLEETFNEGKGILERGGVEEGGRHCEERRFVQRKLVGLVVSVRQLSEESLQVLPSFIALKNFRGILQIAFQFSCLV